MVQLRSSFDVLRLVADAAPFDVNPNFGIAVRLDRFDNVEHGHVYNQVAQLFFDGLEIAKLCEPRHASKFDHSSYRGALEVTVAIQLSLMDLKLGLELAVQHALQADVARHT